MSNTTVGIVLKLDGAQAVEAGFKQLTDSANKAGAALGAMPTAMDSRAFTPALGQIDTGLKQVGMSAAATAAAMRAVPAQFTDIVTSLQGGQNPLTVLMQQGGQLKDMFGGIGPAAKALGSYVAGLVNPFTLAAAAAGSLGAAYYMGSKEADAYAKALIMTGNAAGSTVQDMQRMAQAVATATGATQGAAAEALAAMAASGKIGEDSLTQFSETAVKLQREAGVAVEDTVKAFAKLADDPVKASAKLNEETGFLTHALYEQIVALQKQGDAAGAAALASEEYARVMNGRAESLRQNLGIVEQGWRGIIGAAKSAWDAMLDIGRKQDPAVAANNALNAAKTKLTYLENDKYNPMMSQAEAFTLRQQIAGMEAQKAALEGIAAGKQADAKATAEQKAANDAAIASEDRLGKMREGFATKQQQLNKALSDYNKELANIAKINPNATALDPKRISADLLAIKDKYKETGGGAKAKSANEFSIEQAAAKEWAKTLTDLQAVTLKSEAHTNDYSAAQSILLKQMESPAWRVMTEQMRLTAVATFESAYASEQLFKAKKDEDTLLKRITQANIEAAKARDRDIDALQKHAESAANDVAAQQAQNAAIGLSAVAIADLEAVRLEQNAALLEGIAIKRLDRDMDMQAYDLAKQQADDLRKLATFKREGAVKQVATESAKEAADEWRKTSESINSTLTDALMRGFESGKDFAGNLRDTVVNMFKTMVLRPGISVALSPVSMGVNELLGAGNAVAGASNIGTAVNAASLANNAWNYAGFGSGSSVWSRFATSSMGQSVGLSATVDAIGGLETAATTLTSAGNMFISAMPWVAGIGVALSLLGGLDKSGTPHVGASAGTGSLAGTTNSLFGWSEAQDKKGAEAAQGIATSITSTLDSLDKLSGGLGKFSVATGYLDDSSEDGAWGALIIKKLDGVTEKTLVDWADTQSSKWAPKVFGDGDQGVTDYNLALGKDVKAIIDSMDLPAWAQSIMDSVAGAEPSLETLSQAVDAITAMPEQILQGIGTSTQSLASIILSGMTEGSGTSAAQAGQAFADTITYGIEQSFYGSFATQITSIISTGLVTPIVTAMAAGSSITEAMATLSIDSMVEQATAAAQTLGKIINNEDFKTALGQINAGIADSLAGILGDQTQLSAVPDSLKQAQQTQADQAKTAADTAAKEAEDTAKRHADELLNLQKEHATMEIELLTAQGKSQEALAAQRKIDIETMDDATVAQYDLNKALRAQIDAVKEFWGVLDTLAPKVLKGSALRDYQTTRIGQNLAQSGGFSLDLMPQFKELAALANTANLTDFITSFAQLPEASTKAGVAILNAAGSLYDLADAAEQAHQSAKDQADQALMTPEAYAAQQLATASDTAARTLQSAGFATTSTLSDLSAALGAMPADSLKSQILALASALDAAGNSAAATAVRIAGVALAGAKDEVKSQYSDATLYGSGVSGGGRSTGDGGGSGASKEAKTNDEAWRSAYIDALRGLGQETKADTLAFEDATQGFDDLHKAMQRQIDASKALLEVQSKLVDLTDQYKQAQIDLMKAQGNTSGAAALERDLSIKTFTDAIAKATGRLNEKDPLTNTSIDPLSVIPKNATTSAGYAEDPMKAMERAFPAFASINQMYDKILKDWNPATKQQLTSAELATLGQFVNNTVQSTLIDYVTGNQTNPLFLSNEEYGAYLGILNNAAGIMGVYNEFLARGAAPAGTADAAGTATTTTGITEGGILATTVNTALEGIAKSDALAAIKQLTTSLGTLKTYTDAYAASEVQLLQAKGDTIAAEQAQRKIDLKPVMDDMKAAGDALLKTTSSEQSQALIATIAIDRQAIAQYDLNKAREKEIAGIATYKQAVESLTDKLLQLGTLGKQDVRNLKVSSLMQGLVQKQAITQADADAFKPFFDNMGSKELSQFILAFAQQTEGLSGAAKTAAGDILTAADALLGLDMAAEQTINDLTAQGVQLSAELKGAQGDAAGMTAALREVAIKGFNAAEIAAYDFNDALKKQIAAINEAKGLQSTLNGLLQNTAQYGEGATAAIRSIALAALDISNRPLQQSIWALEDANKAVDNSLSSVQRAIDAEKTRITDAATTKKDELQAQIDANNKASESAQKLVDSVKGITDAITSAVKTLRQQATPEAMGMTQARSFIDMSLMLAQAGAMPDAKKLDDALATLTSDKLDNYASLQDFRFAQAAQAGKLEQLGALAGTQLTDAEAQLKATKDGNDLLTEQIKAIDKDSSNQIKLLDAQYKTAQDSVSALRGIDTSVISVKDAIDALVNAITGAKTAATVATNTPSAGGTGGKFDPPGSSAAQSAYEQSLGLNATYYGSTASDGKYRFENGILYTPTGSAQSIGSMSNSDALAQYQAMFGADNVINLGSKTEGFTAEYAAYLHSIEEDLKNAPKFAIGTDYVPRDMLAQIHEGEAIIPKAYNPAAGGQGGNERLEKLVVALTAEVQRLQAIVNDGNQQQRRTADAVNGRGEVPMMVETV